MLALVEQLEYVESLDCNVSLDDEGEVQITHEERLSDEIIYDLQGSSRSIGYWLADRQGAQR